MISVHLKVHARSHCLRVMSKLHAFSFMIRLLLELYFGVQHLPHSQVQETLGTRLAHMQWLPWYTTAETVVYY